MIYVLLRVWNNFPADYLFYLTGLQINLKNLNFAH